MSQDVELAVEQAASYDEASAIAAPVSFTEWTTEAELLTLVAELVGELLALTSAVNSRDHIVHHPKPLPRPRRAFDEAWARRVDALYDDLLADIERAQNPETEA